MDNNENNIYSNMNLNWYPGHMAKAKRELKESLPLVDIVIELRDSRIPYSSKNPMIDEILGKKPRLILLTKSKLADKDVTKEWMEYLSNDTTKALDIDCIKGYNLKRVIPSIKEVLKEKLDKLREKGLTNKTIRAVIVGIPNVGKSTFINTMAGKKVCKTGDRPGVTKGLTWLRLSDDLQIMDTPGILWPKFESVDVGIKLSICQGIKDEIVDLTKVCMYFLDYAKVNYKEMLKARYNLEDNDLILEALELLEKIARQRGCIQKGNEIDYQRVTDMIMHDLRNQKIGAMSFERPREC
jgi:ribosome biogenesis GTPase A